MSKVVLLKIDHAINIKPSGRKYIKSLIDSADELPDASGSLSARPRYSPPKNHFEKTTHFEKSIFFSTSKIVVGAFVYAYDESSGTKNF